MYRMSQKNGWNEIIQSEEKMLLTLVFVVISILENLEAQEIM